MYFYLVNHKMYGGFGYVPPEVLDTHNIWANMEFLYNPVKTKKQVREEKKAETMKKIEEENKKQNAEFEIALKNLEDLKQQYLNIAQEITEPQQSKNKPIKQTKQIKQSKQNKQIQHNKKPIKNKTPKGKK